MAGLQFPAFIVGFLPVSIGIFYSVKADEINVESAVDESLPESDSFFDIFQAEALERERNFNPLYQMRSFR